MLGKISLFLTGLAPLMVVVCTAGCSPADEVNTFYQRVVHLLRNDRTIELEALVRQNRNLAAKCLQIIKEKASTEAEGERAAAFRLIVEELEEVVLMAQGRPDCEAAKSVYARAAKSVTLDEHVIRLKRVVQLCPSLLDAQLELGGVSKKLGKLEDAVAAYEKALTLQKDCSEAYLGLGETLFAAGLCHRSLPYFEKASALQPDNSAAKKFAKLARREIAQDKVGLLSAHEIADRLLRDHGESLMCMCPVFARLIGRARLQEVSFPLGSATLSSSAKKQLEELATALGSGPLKGGSYLIEGHADITGSASFNQRLSRERAEAVKTYLTQTLGVDSVALATAGMGESRQWTTNETSRGRRLNRRIEILRLEAQRDSSSSGSHEPVR